jgi:hypothetical protein
VQIPIRKYRTTLIELTQTIKLASCAACHSASWAVRRCYNVELELNIFGLAFHIVEQASTIWFDFGTNKYLRCQEKKHVAPWEWCRIGTRFGLNRLLLNP